MEVGEFLSNLTVERAGTFVLLSGMAIATFGISIAFYLHSRMITPLAILCVVIVGWLGVGISSDIRGAIFGFSLSTRFGCHRCMGFNTSSLEGGILCPQREFPITLWTENRMLY